MPWLWHHTVTQPSSQRAIAQLGATDAWARNGRRTRRLACGWPYARHPRPAGPPPSPPATVPTAGTCAGRRGRAATGLSAIVPRGKPVRRPVARHGRPRPPRRGTSRLGPERPRCPNPGQRARSAGRSVRAAAPPGRRPCRAGPDRAGTADVRSPCPGSPAVRRCSRRPTTAQAAGMPPGHWRAGSSIPGCVSVQ